MSDWRALVDAALYGEDTKDRKDDSPEVGASVLSVPSVPLNPDRVLKSWWRDLHGVDPCLPHDGFAMRRWQDLYDTSLWLLDGFGPAAARGGWGAGDLFGIRAGAPRLGGLADQLGTSRSLVLEGQLAFWRVFGVNRRYAAGAYPHLPVWWAA